MADDLGFPNLVDMLAADGAVTAESVAGDLVRRSLDERPSGIRQTEEMWVPDPDPGPFGDRGHWEVIAVIEAP